MQIETKEEFSAFVERIQSSEDYRKPIGFGIFRHEINKKGETLTGTFPVVNWGNNFGSAAVLLTLCGLVDNDHIQDRSEVLVPVQRSCVESALEMFAPYVEEATGLAHKNVFLLKMLLQLSDKELDLFDFVFIFEDTKVESLPAAYLKLSAISEGYVKPNTICLDGVFGALPTVAWCGTKAYDLDELRESEVALKVTGAYPAIDYVDKFPRFLMQTIPKANVRILVTLVKGRL